MNKLEGLNNYRIQRVKIHFTLKREKNWELVWTPNQKEVTIVPQTIRGQGVEGVQVLNTSPLNLKDRQDKTISILVMNTKDEIILYITYVDDPK